MTSSEPSIPHLRLPPNSIPVTDPDEEIYDLYSSLPPSSATNGSSLGMFSSCSNVATIRFELSPSQPASQSSSRKPAKVSGRSKGGTKGATSGRSRDVELEYDISQNLDKLKGSGAGDTGSVIWRASHHFLSYLLPQLYFPSTTIDPPPLLRDPQSLFVLELGSGTGLIAVALAPLFRRYTCSDQYDCLKLLETNLVRNGLEVEYGEEWDEGDGTKRRLVSLQELDWLSFVHDPSSTTKPRSKPPSVSPSSPVPYDLIIASDCIYNPYLIIPFLSTLAHFAQPNRTVVLVVMELREVSVTEEFLTAWLEVSEARGAWEIHRVVMLEEDGFAMWAAWRTA